MGVGHGHDTRDECEPCSNALPLRLFEFKDLYTVDKSSLKHCFYSLAVDVVPTP